MAWDDDPDEFLEAMWRAFPCKDEGMAAFVENLKYSFDSIDALKTHMEDLSNGGET